MKKNFKIIIPATTANLGPLFDTAGAALQLYNEIEVFTTGTMREVKKRAVEIRIDGEGELTLPRDHHNIIWQSMEKVFTSLRRRSEIPGYVQLKCINRIPLASGLGSSAAARLGGILAAYRILDIKLSLPGILSLGTSVEGHPDNIVPAMLGGLCVSTVVTGDVLYAKLPAPELKAVICVPNFELSTEKARKALPKNISFADAVKNVSNAGVLLGLLVNKDYSKIGYVMDDRLHQPYREPLVPDMKKVFDAARQAGAYGVALSGSGPSIIALGPVSKSEHIEKSMKSVWHNSRTMVLDFDNNGAHIIE